MKHVSTPVIFIALVTIFFISCAEKPKKPAPKRTITPGQIAAEPAQNAAGVWHYTCSKRCGGGGGAEGNCADCGAPLLHNTVYHSNANSAPVLPPTSGAPFASPPAASPSGQNAAGVWHYTCSNGCAGGSGAAGNCSSCGGALTHNQAFH